MAAFILTVICDKHRHGQAVCLQQQLSSICANLLTDSNPLLRRWLCFCLAKQYEDYEEAKLIAIHNGIPEKLSALLADAIPEVRAAAAYALGHLVSTSLDPQQSNTPSRAHTDVAIGVELLWACTDGSPLVRREGVIALAKLVLHPYHKRFFEIAARHRKGKRQEEKGLEATTHTIDVKVGTDSSASEVSNSISNRILFSNDPISSIGADAKDYVRIWSSLKEIQSRDPFHRVAYAAVLIVGSINMQMLSEGKTTNAPGVNGVHSSLHRDASLPDLPLLSEERSSMMPQVHSSSVSGDTGIHMPKQHQQHKNTPAIIDPTVSPSFGNFSGIPRPMSQMLHTTAAAVEKTHIPDGLKSTLYKWSKMAFNEPMMNSTMEGEDPLSDSGAARLCRKRKSERLKREAEALSGKDNAASFSSSKSYTLGGGTGSPTSGTSHQQGFFNRKLDQSAILDNDSEMTSLLLFHPFETALVVADEKDGISVWNYEEGEKLVRFSNENQAGSRLTSLEWINDMDESLLLSGSDDGVIRVWYGLHNCVNNEVPRLVTAFPAVPDLVPGTRGSGLVTRWQQMTGMLLCGGNSNAIRVWDMEKEKCIYTVSTGTDSCLTSMACDTSMKGGRTVAGCGDGSLRVFDPRSNPEYSLVCAFKEHQGWVVQTHIQMETHELISGSVSGDIKFWDLRYSKSSIKTIDAHRSPMTALAVHDYAPILASGSHNQFIKVFNMQGATLSMIRYHDGFLGQRIGPVSCLAFHPHKLYLAAGATDSLISIYSSEK